MKPDVGLTLFVIAMRYLAPFIPIHEPSDKSIALPFSVEVVADLDRMKTLCERSSSWRAVYEGHPAFCELPNRIPIVTVVTGSIRFFEAMASIVLPLGKLSAGGAFRSRHANLHVFCQALSRIAGANMLFLYGGPDCRSDYKAVTGELFRGLLAHSAIYGSESFRPD